MKRVLRRHGGFTLIELAVVLAIFGLLLGILVVPLSTQVDQNRIAEAERQLASVREALIGFAIANGRLPCPAISAVATGAANAGNENRVGAACAPGFSEGVLPWATLGVPETDPWGRRLTYRVTLAFADDFVAGMQASFLITDSGNINVTDGAVNIASNVPAVVVSHGKNGRGAWRTDGVQIGGAAGNELENANGTITFVSRGHAPDFDDLVVWVSPNTLKSRMVAANRLP
jgi:prepilin-type N-terminal cleavage/methylation domain-containing protein